VVPPGREGLVPQPPGRPRRGGPPWATEKGGLYVDYPLISNAGIADLYTVFASTDRTKGAKGISCYLVPRDTPGLRFLGPQVLSAPHPLGEIAFEDCRVPADALLATEGRGYGLGLATIDRLRPTVAAAAGWPPGRSPSRWLT
jgi:hypothetical protein